MTQTWKERLQAKLIHTLGKKKATDLSDKYHRAFPSDYMDDYSPEIAANDIDQIEQLSAQVPLKICFYFTPEKTENPLHLRLFQWQKPLPLSDILPMLESMDLRTYDEHPYKIIAKNNQFVWINDFSVTYSKASFEIDKVKDLFEEAFTKIYFGLLENDGFNKLVLDALLSWREVTILRAYAQYLQQVGFRFSKAYIIKALTNNIDITKNLIQFFLLRHNPMQKNSSAADKIEQLILAALENVESLDEDTILRRILALIKATLRTNYFQAQKSAEAIHYLSFKLSSHDIPNLPLPLPLYEIFIYSPRFEAIHLRNTKVARGGIRWSDRPEDFRTEILGLMKAQKVKNAIIVPSGAKGGFVLKALSPFATREERQKEVVFCYQSFIRGLLELTDNIKQGKIQRPAEVKCYDDEDPYLVVAADKGTATFSDLANTIAEEHHFWLGDAFASGGITGYDHKKIGITARGAWESIKRHFRELDIDVEKKTITVVGIGDMSGDVFGNGMLYSKHIQLVAAFDHRHIFIDPSPDPKKSYHERLRLFKLATSSWEDYNPHLISKGGGVFKRTIKSIPLSTEMKKILGTEENALAPNDLIRVILKAPVDLLYNGGIGTYVKSSTETDLDVGDRSNDFCRINGQDLRCKVVGEGGNLGFTQLGRIEYALQSGLINTDFIDNSAGVDCSDHEVNLKILLSHEKASLSFKQRNALLATVTDEITHLVLKDNYYQALVMSFTAFHSKQNINLHQSYIKELETLGVLDRKLEFLPDDKQFIERKASQQGLTRPELAVLLAYTKIYIKHAILKSDVPEDIFLNQVLATAFPPSIQKKYHHAMQKHPLRQDIIATQLSNRIVNGMGITFVYRLQVETGATVAEIIRAHAVASQIFACDEVSKLVQSLGFKIALSTQYEMLYNIRHLINLATRWFLYRNRLNQPLEKIIEHYTTRIAKIKDLIPKLMSGFTHEYLKNLTEQFLKLGLPQDLAERIALYRGIYTALNIIEVATENKFDLIKTAQVYFKVGELFNLVWFRDKIGTDIREGHWNVLARLTLRDEFDYIQRSLTIVMIKRDSKENNIDKLFAKWTARNQRFIKRWEKLLTLLHENAEFDYTMFFITIRELLGLIETSQ